jgi:hypothetical protein
VHVVELLEPFSFRVNVERHKAALPDAEVCLVVHGGRQMKRSQSGPALGILRPRPQRFQYGVGAALLQVLHHFRYFARRPRLQEHVEVSRPFSNVLRAGPSLAQTAAPAQKNNCNPN